MVYGQNEVSQSLWLCLNSANGKHWQENGKQRKNTKKVFIPLASYLLVDSGYIPLMKTISSVRQPSPTNLFSITAPSPGSWRLSSNSLLLLAPQSSQLFLLFSFFLVILLWFLLSKNFFSLSCLSMSSDSCQD